MLGQGLYPEAVDNLQNFVNSHKIECDGIALHVPYACHISIPVVCMATNRRMDNFRRQQLLLDDTSLTAMVPVGQPGETISDALTGLGIFKTIMTHPPANQ
jgi:hypothetical protein